MSPTTHTRRKLELIVDRAHLRWFTEALDAHGVLGYSVFASDSGKGSRGAWTPQRLSEASDRVLVLAVARSEVIDAALPAITALFEEVPGVAFVSDVQVIRAERF